MVLDAVEELVALQELGEGHEEAARRARALPTLRGADDVGVRVREAS